MSEPTTPKRMSPMLENPISLYERMSGSYPTGYGDISLLTVDNTIFHVHRSVLQHSSDVFETIFENGPKSDTEGRTSAPLKIEADAATLELLLAFIYPNKQAPYIDNISTISALFRVAKRYEMEGVKQQLRKGLLEIRLVRNTIVPPLYVKSPLAVLAISYAFECADEARFALRECIKGSLRQHLEDAQEFDFPSELMQILLRLREERMAWFLTRLDSLQWPNNNCFNCARRFGEWKMKTISELDKNLEITQLKTSASRLEKCWSGHIIWTADMQGALDQWLSEAKELENALPSLPRLSR